ncbi:unnamed protein product [Sphagnum balticum]
MQNSSSSDLLPRVPPGSTQSSNMVEPTPETPGETVPSDPYADAVKSSLATKDAVQKAYAENFKYAVGETPGIGGSSQEESTIQNIKDNQTANMQKAIDTENQNIATYTAADNAAATASIQALAKNHTDWTAYKSTNPQNYQKLVAATGGDPNTTDALFATSIPPENVQQTWITGSTYNQLVTDPITGKPTVQSYDLGVQVPQSWTQDKIGTNAVIYKSTAFNPKDPSTYAIFGVNPLTGMPTNQISGNTLDTNANNTATPNYLSILSQNGITVNASDSMADFLSNPDNASALVQAAIQNEGGTPQGTNNPGNVKFANQPGATQGNPAPDGGYYANFDTAQDGQNAILQTYKDLAAKGLSVGDAINAYTGTGGSSQSTASTSTDNSQYGLLANVPGFNPQSSDGLDRTAANYLKQYLEQGKIPTPSSLGISARSGSGGVFNTVADQAGKLYKEATGVDLPNADLLSSNLKLISNNNQLQNQLNVQEGTIQKNFGLSLENMTANNINQSAPIINGLADSLAKASGNVPVAQYLSQIGTLQPEIGSLLAIKNASGTTVADKIAAGDLLPSDLSLDQQKQILSTFLKEANNQSDAIANANAKLYIQTDPLAMNPQNPVNNSMTMTGPDGSTYNFAANSMTPQDLQTAFDDGYSLVASQ